MVYVKSIWKFLSILLLSMVVLLSLFVFVKCPVIAGLNLGIYEYRKDFESDFVDSKIDCVYWSGEQVRPTPTHSPTAAEVAKRIEEEKRVLNLKMSAYG